MRTIQYFATAVFVAIGATGMSQTSNTQTTTPTKAWDPTGHYKLRIAQFEKDIAAEPADTTSVVVLVGDSITEGYKGKEIGGMPLLNQGISGDQVDNPALKTGVRNRVDWVAKAKPTYVCVMIGINDFWGAKQDAAAVIEEYRGMAKALREAVPDAKIIIESTIPSGGKNKDMLPKVDALNKELPKIAASIKADFLLLDPIMKSADGELRPEYTTDGVHLTPAGYTAWMNRLDAYLRQKQAQAGSE